MTDTITRSAPVDVVRCPAKVNLFLELHGKRADGYHELSTLIATVDLFDTLEILPNSSGEIELICDAPGVPSGPTNLVWKAAELMKRTFGVSAGVSMKLTKRIPHEAGLGGGSSDAAGAIAGLNAIWGLHRTVEELAPIAAQLGSDVPAFLTGGGWCTGRGEVVEPVVRRAAPLDLLIVKPPVGCPTAQVYRRVKLDGSIIDGSAMRRAWIDGSAAEVGALLQNRLQDAAFDLQPTVRRVYDRLSDAGPLGVLLCGSGSCVLAIVPDRGFADRLAAELDREWASDGELAGSQTFAVRTWTAEGSIASTSPTQGSAP